ncbi:MAG: acetyltransferase [Acidobacteria bacterium]|nr:acetyltransferase [Acidobacteriota bacterium]
MKRIAIIGAGGFARELAWMLEDISAAISQESSRYETVGFLVSDANRIGPYDSPVLGDFSWLESNRVDALAIGIGTPAVRLKLAEELKRRFPHIAWPALVHPNVKWQQRTMQVGEGVIVCAGNIVTVNVQFEPFCMVNLSCTIGHEAVIGRGCVLNPTVNISGGVELGSGVLVGTGAQILQYVKIGDGATIGAGAVVNKDVSPGTTVVGIPAKELIKKPANDAVAATVSTAA